MSAPAHNWRDLPHEWQLELAESCDPDWRDHYGHRGPEGVLADCEKEPWFIAEVAELFEAGAAEPAANAN